MLSNVQYPMLSGTALPRDFVEYPSQYNEMWAREPAVLAHYARHYQTGDPMPQELLAKVLAAQKFDQGYATTEYLAAALLDQSWHRITRGAGSRRATESPNLKQRHCAQTGLTTRSYHRGITHHISRTYLRADIPRATTHTSGARCWRAIPVSGCMRTAD